VGAAAHTGVVGADDFFAFELHIRFVHIEVIVDELDEVELDRDLVLTGRDNDFALLDYAFVVYFELVIECAARRFDETDAHAGFRDDFLYRFGDEGLLLQEID